MGSRVAIGNRSINWNTTDFDVELTVRQPIVDRRSY
jgi:hypothetical protein